MKVHKYLKIASQIEEDFIYNSSYTEDSIPSIRKLCVKYEASLLTVNNSIDELKNRGLLYGEAGRGIYISKSPQNKGLKPMRKIVVLTRVIVGAAVQKYELDILKGIQDLCQKNKLEIIHLQIEDGSQALGTLQKTELMQENDTGFVIIFEDESVLDLAHVLKREKHRYVFIANEHVPKEHMLNFDLRTGINAALRDLNKQGCREFHYIGPDNPTLAFKGRHQILERFLKRYDLWNDKHRIHLGPPDDLSSRAGYCAAQTLLKTGVDVDVLFVADDRMMLGVMIYLKEKGISCPEQIAVFGVGNNEVIDEEFIPTISSIDYEGPEIGRSAFFQLFEMKRQPDVKSRYVKRESTLFN